MVEITTIGEPNTREYEAAKQLEQLFENALPHTVEGRILIAAGFTCFGDNVNDIDLVVFGHLSNGWLYQEEIEGYKKRIYVRSFCFCIEVKNHLAEEIRFEGLKALVPYGKGLSDATSQSQKQKYALRRFLLDVVNWDPWILNFIWFKNLLLSNMEERLRNVQSKDSRSCLHRQHNFLPGDLSIEFLMRLAFAHRRLYQPEGKDYYVFSCVNKKTAEQGHAKLLEAYNAFTRIQENLGKLTRDKLEKITKRALLKDQDYAQAIGKKLVVVRGRAGTGKTIKLIHIAYDLCRRQAQRCLILTFNKALCSDIQRTIRLYSKLRFAGHFLGDFRAENLNFE